MTLEMLIMNIVWMKIITSQMMLIVESSGKQSMYQFKLKSTIARFQLI